MTQAKQIGNVSEKNSSICLYEANNLDVSHMEGRVPQEFGKDAAEIPGARDLLASLEAANAPWAIVTSGTRPLINGWLDVMRLAHPKRMVTAEDVENGKPGKYGSSELTDTGLTYLWSRS